FSAVFSGAPVPPAAGSRSAGASSKTRSSSRRRPTASTSSRRPPITGWCWNRLERMCEFVQAYTKPDGRAPLIGDADDGRIQILGTQQVGDHRYLLSHAAVLFERGDFKMSADRCWEETFWLLG